MNSLLSPHHESLLHLEAIANPSTPIVSVYLNFPSHPNEGNGVSARLRDQLGPLKAMAQADGLDHASAMALRSGIDRILELEPTLEGHRGHGWGIFVCESLDLEEQVFVPPRVWDCAIVGSRPYLRPLRAALDEFRRVATVVFDARRAEVTVSFMGEILEQRTLRAEVVRKSNRAGWHGLDEHRNRQHAEEVRKRLWREITETLAELRRDLEIEVIFVGGQHKATEGLVGSFPGELRDLVGDTFNVDLHTMTQAQLIPLVNSLEETHEHRREEDLVGDIYGTAAARGWASVGIDDVAEAVNRKAVAELVVQHSAMVVGRACPSCDRVSRSEHPCAECGSATDRVPDILEAMVNGVASSGGLVEHVSAETALAGDLVAAKLRFPLQ